VGVAPIALVDTDIGFMQRALARAEQAAAEGEVPVGALLLAKDGSLLAEAGNAPIATHDASAHAEIRVLRAAGAVLKNYRLPNTTLFVTLEPCAMCATAIVHARVARLVYAAPDPRSGACGSVFNLAQCENLNHRVEVVGGVLAEESSQLLRQFFAARR
jgi:tRNA(adenine34) deaminase